MDLTEIPKGHADQDATVCCWVVNAPFSHPFWPFVTIGCVHLRELPGQSRPPSIALPGATHEIFVMALDPEHYPPKLSGVDVLRTLQPANYIGQFIAASDEAAAAQVETSVIEVTRGILNPDSDGRRQWKLRYGDSNFRKFEPGSVGQIIGDGGTVIMLDEKQAVVLEPGLPATDTGEGQTKQ